MSTHNARTNHKHAMKKQDLDMHDESKLNTNKASVLRGEKSLFLVHSLFLSGVRMEDFSWSESCQYMVADKGLVTSELVVCAMDVVQDTKHTKTLVESEGGEKEGSRGRRGRDERRGRGMEGKRKKGRG